MVGWNTLQTRAVYTVHQAQTVKRVFCWSLTDWLAVCKLASIDDPLDCRKMNGMLLRIRPKFAILFSHTRTNTQSQFAVTEICIFTVLWVYTLIDKCVVSVISTAAFWPNPSSWVCDCIYISFQCTQNQNMLTALVSESFSFGCYNWAAT